MFIHFHFRAIWNRGFHCDNDSTQCQPRDPHKLIARVIHVLQVRGSRMLDKAVSLQDEVEGGGNHNYNCFTCFFIAFSVQAIVYEGLFT